MPNTTNTTLTAWAPYFALMVTIVGAAWGLAWSLSGSLARLEDKVEQNAAGIERNAQAIERNAQAIERNAQAIVRNAQANAQAIAKVQEAVANLAGQYREHVRHHDEAPASR